LTNIYANLLVKRKCYIRKDFDSHRIFLVHFVGRKLTLVILGT